MSQITFPKAVNDAYLEVLAESNSTNWVLFGYDKNSNDLKVVGSGDGGLEELAEEWDDAKIQYAFCRVVEPISKLPKYVLMSWCGEGVPVSRKGLVNSHLNDAARYFKGFHVQINARDESDISPDVVLKKFKRVLGQSMGSTKKKHQNVYESVAPVGSVYQPVRTNPKSLNETNNVEAYAPAAPSAAASTPAYRNPAAEIEQLRRADEERLRRESATTSGRESETRRQQERAEQEEREREREREREQREAEARRARESETRARESEARAREIQERDRREREERDRRDAEEREMERERQREEERRSEQERATSKSVTPAPPPPPSVSTSGQLTAVALYAYEAQEENEIDFDENEIITGIEKLDEGWWQGVNAKGRMGLFPANYVQLTEDEAPAALAAPVDVLPVEEAGGDYREAIALYDYEAAEENEVSFAAGDKITHIVFVSEEWWQGKVNGAEGLFPGNYVELSN
ncbi:hypothetical protein BC829DRAFT_158831 [Chytridium lagenaria]|nr:hypothetical protein BC829DRAFT_158831 [Chytridium lagenaria]